MTETGAVGLKKPLNFCVAFDRSHPPPPTSKASHYLPLPRGWGCSETLKQLLSVKKFVVFIYELNVFAALSLS